MTPKNERPHAEIANKLLDTDRLKESLKKAAREAVLDHARAGEPIVVWRDQKIVTEDANAALNE
jgi:hypothetical protein